MIKNEQQRAVTERQRQRLVEGRDVARARAAENAIARVQLTSLEADIAELDRELAAYAAAKAGQIDLAAIESVADLGETLVQARIAAAMSQDDLARALGQKAQQVQRYERNEYRTASLETLRKVAGVLKRAVASEEVAG